MRNAHTDASDRRDLAIAASCKIPASAGMTTVQGKTPNTALVECHHIVIIARLTLPCNPL